ARPSPPTPPAPSAPPPREILSVPPGRPPDGAPPLQLPRQVVSSPGQFREQQDHLDGACKARRRIVPRRIEGGGGRHCTRPRGLQGPSDVLQIRAESHPPGEQCRQHGKNRLHPASQLQAGRAPPCV